MVKGLLGKSGGTVRRRNAEVYKFGLWVSSVHQLEITRRGKSKKTSHTWFNPIGSGEQAGEPGRIVHREQKKIQFWGLYP